MNDRKPTLALLALIAGVALASQVALASVTQSIKLPKAAQVQVRAVLTPGDGGAQFSNRLGWVDEEELRGGQTMSERPGWVDEEDLRIVDFTGGLCSIVGSPAVAVNASHQHSISQEIVRTRTGFQAMVVVRDDDSDLTVCSRLVDLGPKAPLSAEASGQSVLSLTAR